ncbi:MAG: cobyrinate a,c-diamide synthase [Burkholderiales bacterium]
MNPARLLISAAHKSSGKTTISTGLCAALRQRDLSVQTFKKGPDYIDPMWLHQASGRPCRNLDFYLAKKQELQSLFVRHAAAADISVIEGNNGLYDGLDPDGSDSNAALARLLGAPVILVIDARGMTRGIAPLILGYQAFDRNLHIAGVILNRVGGTRHESKLRAVIERYTDMRVLGGVHEDPALQIEERHLGLMPSNEAEHAARTIETMAALVGSQVDLDGIVDIARNAPPLAAEPIRFARLPAIPRASGKNLRIGMVRDRAFGFYYADDLEALTSAGAELVFVDTLHDQSLPAIDGLIIGGGFPEMFLAELEANTSLRERIRQAIEAGLPVYAECGGLMYLSRSIAWHGVAHSMVGAIAGDVTMHAKPVGRGYVRLRQTGLAPWSAAPAGVELCAHEFHYSSLDNPGKLTFAYQVVRGYGIDGQHDGIVYKNVLASYAHLRSAGTVNWAENFLGFVRRVADTQRACLPDYAECVIA